MKNSSSVYYVYLHRRATDNSVFYVGKGKQDRAYFFHRRSRKWKNIKEKHGCIVDIVFSGLTEHQAFYLEKKMIQKIGMDTLANIATGGQGASLPWSEESRGRRVEAIRKAVRSTEWIESHNKRMQCPKYRAACSKRLKKIHSIPEIKKKHRDAVKSWASSEENKKRVSEFFSGRKKPKSMVEKTRQRMLGKKMGPAQKAALESANEIRKKSVICVELNIKFESAKKAAEFAKLSGCKNKSIEQQIRHVCKGRNRTAGGFSWKYEESK